MQLFEAIGNFRPTFGQLLAPFGNFWQLLATFGSFLQFTIFNNLNFFNNFDNYKWKTTSEIDFCTERIDLRANGA